MESQAHEHATEEASGSTQGGRANTRRSSFRSKHRHLLQEIKGFYRERGMRRLLVDGEAVRFLSRVKQRLELRPSDVFGILARCEPVQGKRGTSRVTQAALQVATDIHEMFGGSDEEQQDVGDSGSEPDEPEQDQDGGPPLGANPSGSESDESEGDQDGDDTPTGSSSTHISHSSEVDSPPPPAEPSGSNSAAAVASGGSDESSDGASDDNLPVVPRRRRPVESPVVSESSSDEEPDASPQPATQLADVGPNPESATESADVDHTHGTSSDEDGTTPTLPRVKRVVSLQGDSALVDFERSWISADQVPVALVRAFQTRGMHARTLNRFIEDEANESSSRNSKRKRARGSSSSSEEEED